MSEKKEGRYEIQYHGPSGWWTGHHGYDLKDPAQYTERANKNPGPRARVVEKETGEIFGDSTTCSICDLPHAGLDGSCLL